MSNASLFPQPLFQNLQNLLSNMKIVLQHSRFLRRYFVTMNTESISPSIGTIIYDLDVSQPMTNEILKKLRSIWLERQVIIIRGQRLTSEQYLGFAKQLGTPDLYPFLKGLESFPEITPILKKETETANFGGVWHSDTTYQPCPPMATMLYALELPPIGGDTLFANQVQAYESLSDGLKDTRASLNIICRSDKAVAMATRADRIAERGATPTRIIWSAYILLFERIRKLVKKLYMLTGLTAVILKAGQSQRVKDY